MLFRITQVQPRQQLAGGIGTAARSAEELAQQSAAAVAAAAVEQYEDDECNHVMALLDSVVLSEEQVLAIQGSIARMGTMLQLRPQGPHGPQLQAA